MGTCNKSTCSNINHLQRYQLLAAISTTCSNINHLQQFQLLAAISTTCSNINYLQYFNYLQQYQLLAAISTTCSNINHSSFCKACNGHLQLENHLQLNHLQQDSFVDLVANCCKWFSNCKLDKSCKWLILLQVV